MIFAVLLEKKLRIWIKLRFLVTYGICLFLNKYQPETREKVVCFLDGRKFHYWGQHLNLLLDHLSVHLGVYHKYYSDASTVFDVGASFGTFSSTVNYFNPQAKIFAFEPARESFILLKKNCRGIDNIKPLNYAVGRLNGKVYFGYNRDSPEESTVIKKGDSGHRYQVKQISLDDFVVKEKIDSMSLLKIDVEGYEAEVLRGAEKILPFVENVIIETNMRNLKNVLMVIQIMVKNNFLFTEVGSINYMDSLVDSLDLIFKKQCRK